MTSRGFLVAAALVAAFLLPISAQAQTHDSTPPTFSGGPSYQGGAGRPAGCPHAWCGCWLAMQKFGRNVRHLWLARNWAKEGRPAAQGCINCVAVLSRGKRGGHVGEVVGWDGPNPVIRSGNHNRRVGTATYPARRLIALRSV